VPPNKKERNERKKFMYSDSLCRPFYYITLVDGLISGLSSEINKDLPGVVSHAFGRQRQEDHEFEVSLDYLVRP
jgi:hypothetical protein